MAAEINVLIHHGKWESVPRPPAANVVGNKCVYKLKRQADGLYIRPTKPSLHADSWSGSWNQGTTLNMMDLFIPRAVPRRDNIDKIFITDQENESDRPTMASVCGNSVVVPLPSRTSYFMPSTVEEQTSRPVLDILSCTKQPSSNIEVID
ncbi:hypothetical protein NC653_030683 [Populus alba x Populus x berolinensis]|uniref:Uncharacterized protein n=1 Tax=Populus alba x Populus x berolinensis TaxID=444605 RepID=A0AAD6Q2E1_9ROSI|nr:hypothetical protein NC653_030683 [Populus alba x Populus x berolinensis]